VVNLVAIVAILLAVGPLTVWGVRLARRHRRVAFGAASLLLLFGVNFSTDPPPPPRIEAAKPGGEEAGDDEPK